MLVAFPPRRAVRLAGVAGAGMRACEGCLTGMAGAGARPGRCRRQGGQGYTVRNIHIYAHMTADGAVMIPKTFFLT